MKKSKILKFKNENLGILTVIIKENEFWFIGKEVAKILDYTSNISLVLIKKVSEKNKRKINREDCNESLKECLYKHESDYTEKVLINEEGVFEFIKNVKERALKTNSVNRAIEFEKWIYNEINPRLKQVNTESLELAIKPISRIVDPTIETIKEVANWINIEKEKAEKWDLFVEFMGKMGFIFNENK